MNMSILIGLILLLANVSHSADRPAISGAVAYTDIVRFDYSKNGKKDNVQFWIEFKGSPEAGRKGEPGYQPASGALYYYLLDVDRKTKVANWLMGFSMMSEPPPGGPYPITNLVIDQKKASFEAFRMKWTIEDGGAGYTRDSVTVDDGFKPKQMKMYAGDISVRP